MSYQTNPNGTLSSYLISNGTIWGSSFAFKLSEPSFLTWRQNIEIGEYWLKFHFKNSKEIRLIVSELGLEEILNSTYEIEQFEIIENENGDKYVLERNERKTKQ